MLPETPAPPPAPSRQFLKATLEIVEGGIRPLKHGEHTEKRELQRHIQNNLDTLFGHLSIREVPFTNFVHKHGLKQREIDRYLPSAVWLMSDPGKLGDTI